ncbi:MAG: hypothetical protein ACLU97_08975 [Dorea sp.]
MTVFHSIRQKAVAAANRMGDRFGAYACHDRLGFIENKMNGKKRR